MDEYDAKFVSDSWEGDPRRGLHPDYPIRSIEDVPEEQVWNPTAAEQYGYASVRRLWDRWNESGFWALRFNERER